MAVVPIIQIQNEITPEILLTKCKAVKVIDEEIKQIAKDLIDTALAATDPEAAGLSAPQIGISKRICVVRKFSTAKNVVDQSESLDTVENQDSAENPLSTTVSKEYILINPEITSKSGSTDIGWEACLSIPNVYGRVQRHKQIKLKALDQDGNKIKLKATGFFARVIQHEIDHLNGILFTSKVVGETKTDEEMDSIFAE